MCQFGGCAKESDIGFRAHYIPALPTLTSSAFTSFHLHSDGMEEQKFFKEGTHEVGGLQGMSYCQCDCYCGTDIYSRYQYCGACSSTLWGPPNSPSSPLPIPPSPQLRPPTPPTHVTALLHHVTRRWFNICDMFRVAHIGVMAGTVFGGSRVASFVLQRDTSWHMAAHGLSSLSISHF